MSQLDKLYVVTTGMITPVGMNTAMTAASVNAGINVYQPSTMLDGYFSPIKMTQVPEDALPPLCAELKNLPGINAQQSRMLRLVEPALKEVLADINNPLAVFMAGPEPLSNGPLPIRSAFLNHLQIQTGISFDLDNSKVFPMGRAAAFFALEYAFNYLETSNQDLVLVGGVDTYWHPMTLGALAKDKRLKTVNGEPDGFVPGEGAGFILLSKNESLNNNRQVFRPGLSDEPGHRFSEEPYMGDGLSAAFNQALDTAKAKNINQIYSSANGELFGSKEYGVALSRNSTSISENCKHIHPADCYGDLGAALGVVLLSLSSMNSPVPTLCYGSSDGPLRGAACVI